MKRWGDGETRGRGDREMGRKGDGKASIFDLPIFMSAQHHNRVVTNLPVSPSPSHPLTPSPRLRVSASPHLSFFVLSALYS